MKNTVRYLLIFIGITSVALGAIGVFLPLLPTTPFILLALWCFARSSERFHNWLMQHPNFGPLITMWYSDEGIPVSSRNRILALMWLSLIISMLIIAKLWSVALLSTIGISVSWLIHRKTRYS